MLRLGQNTEPWTSARLTCSSGPNYRTPGLTGKGWRPAMRFGPIFNPGECRAAAIACSAYETSEARDSGTSHKVEGLRLADQ
jgi:hypothetical protein